MGDTTPRPDCRRMPRSGSRPGRVATGTGAHDIAQDALLLHRLGVVVVPDGRGDYEHNAALLVVDDQGLVRIFDQAEQQLALDYARDLAQRQLP